MSNTHPGIAELEPRAVAGRRFVCTLAAGSRGRNSSAVRSFVRTLDRLQNGEKEGPSGEEVAGETVRGRVDVPRGGADV